MGRVLWRTQLLLLWLINFCVAWNEWKYSVTWSTAGPDDVLLKTNVWNSTWFNKYYKGDASPPRPRKGHSLHIIKTDARFDEYAGRTYLVLFGGRDNDQIAEHIPKTYNVENVRATRLH